jgi:hypothetical protein
MRLFEYRVKFPKARISTVRCLTCLLVPVVLILLVMIPNKYSETLQKSQACSMSSIDIFLVASAKDLPLLPRLLKSIDLFMPERGMTHILMEKIHIPLLQIWIDIYREDYSIYEMLLPEDLRFIPGYIIQQYTMMWADNVIFENTGRKPKFIMFMDLDSTFAAPATRSSLFDGSCRPYIGGWPMASQLQFRNQSLDFVGLGDISYMYE